MKDMTYDEAFHDAFNRLSHNWGWAMTPADQTAQRLLEDRNDGDMLDNDQDGLVRLHRPTGDDSDY